MRAGGSWIVAALLTLAVWPAHAEGDAPRTAPPILIVDRERALRESEPAASLGEQERRARIALKSDLDKLRAELETEEANIAAMREIAPKDVFEERVHAFDIRVRDARRESQERGEALQARFVAARRDLAAALEPVLQELLDETGAALIVDARTVLAARDGADVTEEVIRRFNERAEIALPPEQPPANAPSSGR